MLAEWNLPFRALVDAAPDGLLVCDGNGTIVVVNSQAEKMFGYAHEELVKQTIEILIPEQARARHGHHIASFTAAPRLRPMGQNLELRGRRKDGTEFPIEISLSPINTDHGLLVIAGIRDVTERHTLELANKRANAYLVSAVDAVQDAFTLFDEHDRVVMLNSVARQMLGGRDGERVIGRSFAEVLRDALANGVFDFSNETRESLFERWSEYHRAPSGTLEVRSGTGRYLRIHEHKTADHGTVSTIVDVTDDVVRAEELGRAREVAEAASAAKSEFLSSMSHELRTPLNAILGFAQLLERDRKRPLDERQLERIGHVLRGGEHLLRLIDDVLDLSRIEAGRISVSLEPVAVAGVLAEVGTTLAPKAQSSGITLAIEPVAKTVPHVIADRTRLAQVLMNFGSNAIKYNKPNGHVTFRTTTSGARVRIVVSDDGVGIPAEQRTKVFEPFQRAGQETGPIEGTGIGLTISRRLADLMNARVDFSSEVGRGSEFWIDLYPEPSKDAGYERTSASSGSTPAALAGEIARYKVVYVEDNPSNIAFMRDLIAELPSVHLLVAPTAEIGIPLVVAEQPHVVIMDVNLPGMSGFEAVKRLKALPETRAIPIIGLSAAALLKDTARATGAGFYRYLTKPVKVDELFQTLEVLLAGNER
jgi:PAS domain S-box-containing protein